MRLVLKSTQAPMGVGSIFPFRRTGMPVKLMKIVHAPEPHKSSSEGKITCAFPDSSQSEYYASVWGLEWIEREDRLAATPEMHARREAWKGLEAEPEEIRPEQGFETR